jgi:proton-translocating NAD(P)+ transhydrogenase subunit beta
MMPMGDNTADILFLVSSVLFIFGLKGLTHPRTALRGNMAGALGMLLAVVTALASQGGLNWIAIVLGLAIGSAIGALLALRIQMTGMPQMVAIFNGFGGGASVLVAGVALALAPPGGSGVTHQTLISTVAAVIIGAVTFWGSLVAFSKLAGLIRKNLVIPAQKWVNGILALACFICALMVVCQEGGQGWFWTMTILACLLGVFLVAPIGGADMPVVIAALNAYSGLAACGTGFVFSNLVLIISGSLVGASGLILTRIMCRAMNRSFVNVIFGTALGGGMSRAEGDAFYEGRIKATSAEEVAMVLESARSVMIVPGYGMAVSQAQHAVRDLSRLLDGRGIGVSFAIHPVAGRMPGHMNVLLAEADIPYDKLNDLDAANAAFDQVDVAIVIGANDVVNPEARQNPDSPIAGMPILNVDKAKTVVVVKRSLSPGFAGIPNPLFVLEHTLMLFGDGKAATMEITAALKEGR